MNDQHDKQDELIELGVASVETRGAPGNAVEIGRTLKVGAIEPE